MQGEQGKQVGQQKEHGGAEQQVTVPVGVEREVLFELKHRGATPIEIEVEAGPKELTLANNRAAVMVRKVLASAVASARPRQSAGRLPCNRQSRAPPSGSMISRLIQGNCGRLVTTVISALPR